VFQLLTDFAFQADFFLLTGIFCFLTLCSEMEHKSLIAFALVLQAGTKLFKDGFALISYLMAMQTRDFQRKGNLQATCLRSYLPTDGNSCNQQHTSTTDPDSG
jgi:hypothetical protein